MRRSLSECLDFHSSQALCMVLKNCWKFFLYNALQMVRWREGADSAGQSLRIQLDRTFILLQFYKFQATKKYLPVSCLLHESCMSQSWQVTTQFPHAQRQCYHDSRVPGTRVWWRSPGLKPPELYTRGDENRLKMTKTATAGNPLWGSFRGENKGLVAQYVLFIVQTVLTCFCTHLV